MNQSSLEEFLESLWFSEITLYYNRHTYWCECWHESNGLHNDKIHMFVYRYVSDICYDQHGKPYTKRHIENGDVLDYSCVFDIYEDSLEEAKRKFYAAKIFDGASFWEAEKDIEWYEEL